MILNKLTGCYCKFMEVTLTQYYVLIKIETLVWIL